MTNFPIDQDGYLINIGSAKLIQSEFKDLLDEIVLQLTSNIGRFLDGVYVRGSISSGLAIPTSSDADIVAFTNEQLTEIESRWLLPTVDKIKSEFNVISELDLTIVTTQDLLADGKFPQLKVNLAVQSVRIFGKKLDDLFPKCKPDKSLARYMFPQIREEFSRLRGIFIGENKQRSYQGKEKANSFWCIWTMRDILRSAHALTMAKTGVFERDLTTCLENTVIVHPELKPYLVQALFLALHPSEDGSLVLKLLDQYLPIFFDRWNADVLSD